jgi:hypothetical protein
MRVLYIEGVAIRGGLESCVVVREGGGEALTGGVRAGLLSREMAFRGADAVQEGGRPHLRRRYRESSQDPARSWEPGHVRKSPCARTGRSRGRPRAPMMPRPGWFAGWKIGAERAVRGTLWR